MNRFFGMMPSKEIEKTCKFRYLPDESDIEIQAGPNGWTIIYPDEGTAYKDESIGTEKNLENAKKKLYSDYKSSDLKELMPCDDCVDDSDADVGECDEM